MSRTILRRAAQTSGLAAMAALVACSSEPTLPEPPELTGPLTLRRISAPIGDDTIHRTIRDPLVYEITDARGVPARGIRVRFRSGDSTAGRLSPGTPFMWMGPFEEGVYSTLNDIEVRTDSTGRAAVLLSRGTHAGSGKLVVTVDSLSLADTLRFRHFMGSPSSLRMEPRDTAVFAGASFTIHARLLDQWGNSDTTTVRPRSDSGAVSIAGSRLTAASIGFANLSAEFGTLSAVGRVSVVPPGLLAIVEGAHAYPGTRNVVVMRTDGSERRVLYSWPVVVFTHWSIDWLDRSTLIIPNPHAPGFLRITLEGEVTAISVGPAGEIRRPSWVQSAPDGRTVYFTYGDGPVELWSADLQSGATTLLAGMSLGFVATLPAVSPDGRSLAFALGAGGASLWRLDLAGGSAARSLGLRGTASRWHPDGQRLVFLDGTLLRIANADASGQRVLSTVGMFPDIGFDLSPDGRWAIARNGNEGATLFDLVKPVLMPVLFTTPAQWIAWQP